MYAKVHSYSRYFAQAPKVAAAMATIVAETKARGAATVCSKHALVNAAYRTTFERIGGVVIVDRFCRGERLKSEMLTLTAGRALYRELVSKRWTKF